MPEYKASYLEDIKKFIEFLPDDDQGKIKSSIITMESGDFVSVHIKTLRTPIKELIVKKYRLIFFTRHTIIYFIGAFIKKTAKTPKNEIINAEKRYKTIIRINT